MFYLRDLRVRLQERRNRLYRAGFKGYEDELRYLFHFLDENSYTRSLLSVLDENPSVDFEQWAKELEEMRGLQFPESEEGRAKICHQILRRCNNAGEWQRWIRIFSPAHKFDDQFQDLTEAVVDPLVNFLHDRIDDAGNVLFVIERYKLQVEWFKREELYHLYKSDTSIGEASLDRQLRAALFEGGIDYPFSQPASPSGEADIVASLGSNDPLVLEVKLFDPELSKSTAHLRQGFHQVLRYANDYNQSVGYLVIFNCSDSQLVVASTEAEQQSFPPRINYGSKTFFVIPIDIYPNTLSASREKPSTRQVINQQDLIGHLNDE